MPNAMWTVKSCLDWTRDYLKDKGDERPRLSAEWLLSGVTGLSRTELYTNFDKPLSPEELDTMHTAVVRRVKGEPLQYIIGETDFRFIRVVCEPGVLIPRPETELLVEEVLNYLDREVIGADGGALRTRVELPWNEEVEAARRAEEEAASIRAAETNGVSTWAVDDGPEVGVFGARHDMDDEADGELGELGYSEPEAENEVVGQVSSADAVDGDELEAGVEADAGADASRVARVLEVGTGTGCISLSLAHEREGKVVCVATDIEPRAVDLACRNRDALGIAPEAVDIRLGNLVSPLDRDTEWGTFDVLVSNPPYIPTPVMQTLPREVVDFEPALALDGGEDGLGIFRRLVNAAPYMLRAGGLLACELFEGHLDQACEIARDGGLEDVCVVNDLTGRPRILLACTPAVPSASASREPVHA